MTQDQDVDKISEILKSVSVNANLWAKNLVRPTAKAARALENFGITIQGIMDAKQGTPPEKGADTICQK